MKPLTALSSTNRWRDPLTEFSHSIALRMWLTLKATHDQELYIDLLTYAPQNAQPEQSSKTRLLENFYRLLGVEVVRLILHFQQQSAALINRASRFIRH